MKNSAKIRTAFEQGGGIFRLAPNWVPRSFCIPGRRIKLHPDDYYALGGNRGGIDERWLGCTTPADNGPLTGVNEGISHLVAEDGGLIPLTEAVEELGAELLGERIWNQYRSWPVYSKFFDNLGPLPHHIHHREEHAKLVGQHGKPESYYFPPPAQQPRRTFPVHVLRIRTGNDKRTGPSMPGKFLQRRQQDHESVKGLSSGTGNGLGRPSGNPARTRLPLHL